MSQAEFERLCGRIAELEEELATTRKLAESLTALTPQVASEPELRHHLRHMLAGYATAKHMEDPEKSFTLGLTVTGLDTPCVIEASITGMAASRLTQGQTKRTLAER